MIKIKTVGHTGLARLCLVRQYYRTRTETYLQRWEAPTSTGGGGCHRLENYYDINKVGFYMRKVRIEWSYPMDINNIIYDERMSDIGLYYITRNFGGHITDLYIGKTTYNFHSRLESHIKN